MDERVFLDSGLKGKDDDTDNIEEVKNYCGRPVNRAKKMAKMFWIEVFGNYTKPDHIDDEKNRGGNKVKLGKIDHLVIF